MMTDQPHRLSIQRACQVVRLSRAAYYRPPQDRLTRDQDVIDALNRVVTKRTRWGFWKCYDRLRLTGHRWNHKRVHRVYCALRLNLPRRTRRRVPRRIRRPLEAPAVLNTTWAIDFMCDSLYDGRRFRTLNVIDEGNREGLAIAGEGEGAGTRYVFTGLNAIKPAMIEEATRNARQTAEKFAADSSSTLGKIRRASQGQFSIEDRDRSTPHLKRVRVVSTVDYYLQD